MTSIGNNTTTNPQWLAFFRCGIAIISLLHFLAIMPDFNLLFSEKAIIPPDISAILRDGLLPTIYSIQQLFAAILHYQDVLFVFKILYPLSLLCLGFGFFTRVAACMALLLQLILFNSFEVFSYGVDVFTNIALFYCVVFPVGKLYALDNWLFKKQPIVETRIRYLRLFQTHVCLIYFFSGFEKILGTNWRNGESVWKMAHGYNISEAIDVNRFADTPFFLIIGWATIILELLYPLFINIKYTRQFWLFSIIIFHVAIAFFMGLYFFSAVMILLNLTTYYMPYLPVNNGFHVSKVYQ